MRGVLIANEVLDALPAERFRIGEAAVEQLCVTVSEGSFAWTMRPAPEELESAVRQVEREPPVGTDIARHDEPWVSEQCLALGSVGEDDDGAGEGVRRVIALDDGAVHREDLDREEVRPAVRDLLAGAGQGEGDLPHPVQVGVVVGVSRRMRHTTGYAGRSPPHPGAPMKSFLDSWKGL